MKFIKFKFETPTTKTTFAKFVNDKPKTKKKKATTTTICIYNNNNEDDQEQIANKMPIVGQQYANGFRPYSSFRVTRGSCGYHNNNNSNTNAGQQPLSKRTTTTTTTAATSNGKNTANSSSTCSSSSSLNQQQLPVTNGFSRQQPWRSSYCSSNRRLPETLMPSQQQQQLQQQRNVKPLTPKLIRRIENTCATNNTVNSRYGKSRAPAPPANRKPNATTLQPAANPPQKRAYQATNNRCAAKENCPTTATATRNTHRSCKNYPAPLPPQQSQQQQRKQPNDLIALKATPLAQRRQLPATPKLSLRQRAAPAEGGGSSTGSSDSHDSPKLKKAFSKKFPQGLPFEDEFYGSRNRSYSQSSSNYSFYSSVGATTTPHDDDDDDEDEFQRKPATDESLYVDFSKVVHSHKQQRQYVPASSWIRASPDHQTSHNTVAANLTPAQQRRKSAKYARSMHDYLYSDDANDTTTTTTTKHRLSVVDEPEDGYYSYAAGTPEPQTPPTPHTDIYVAAASWAPKPLYPDRVLLPSTDSNNNNNCKLRSKQTQRRSEHLGSTTCEYNFDDSLSSSRRRKERSKRSHRKSPATGRRQHKYRYRDEASHSSSRRRHRDRPKDERDSGRNNRQSPPKVKTFHFLYI